MAVCTARPFGVDTIPPSLRPVTAWLAPHCKPLRRFMSEHTPLALILHADPTALDVGERAALLRRYAELQKAGRLRHEYADQHALWMFADPSLAKTIKDVWPEADDNFRFELLRLVEQGGLLACANLAADVVLDQKAGPYSRILAARVLAKFGKTAALRRLASAMLESPDEFSPRLGPDLAVALFPKTLTVASLLSLIARSSAQEAALAKAKEIRHRDWIELRRTLVANPEQLQDEALFLKWPDYGPLVSMTKWLANGEERDRSKAVLRYQDIAIAFSPEVAEAYRQGMRRFWRIAKPRPPTISPEQRTTPWSSLLSMAGLALEAATTPSWTETLDLDEARLAARHVFISGQDFPDWLDALLVAFPDVVEPYLLKELKREWSLERPGYTPLLYRAGIALPMTRGVQAAFLRMVKAGLPAPI